MKLHVDTVPVTLGGVAEGTEFRIKNSAKTFRILSDGLYSNKFKAIIRELACNAHDSHVAAGCPNTPFDIQLPTTLDPVFRIRDYGLGLDHDGVTLVYTTYGESTKEETNDQTGCLGLGSKSPFSYTDNFTVTAWKDGIKRIYTAYINDKGIPCLGIMGETETDEPNGLEVSFAVNGRGDMQNFANEISDVLKWFDTKPNLFNYSNEVPEIKYVQREAGGPGVHLIDAGRGSYYGREMRIYARMGNVAYPVEVGTVYEQSDSNVPELLRLRATNGQSIALLLEIPMGDLDFAASREQLSYDARTVRNLRSKLDAYVANFAKNARTLIEAESDPWERVKLLTKLGRTNTSYAAVAEHHFSDLFPAGISLREWSHYGYSGPSLSKNLIPESDKFFYNVEAREQSFGGRLERVNNDSLCDVNSHGGNETITLQPIIILDRGGSLHSILSETIDPRRCIIVSIHKRNENERVDMKEKKAYADEIVAALKGHPAVHKISDLAAQTKKVHTPTGIKSFRLNEVEVSRYSREFRAQPMQLSALIDQAKTYKVGVKEYYLYVPMKALQVSLAIGDPLKANDFIYATRDIFSNLISIKSVIAVSEKDIDRLPKDKNWMRLDKYVAYRLKQQRADLVSPERMAGLERTAFGSAISSNGLARTVEALFLASMKYTGSSTTVFGRLMDETKRLINVEPVSQRDINQFNNLLQAFEMMNVDRAKIATIDLDGEKVAEKVATLVKETSEAYPMLNSTSFDSGDESIKNVLDYVALVDKA